MDSCKHLNYLNRELIKTSVTYDEYKTKVASNLAQTNFPVNSKIISLKMYSQDIVKTKHDLNNFFDNFLRIKDFGCDDFKDDECICQRFLYIGSFKEKHREIFFGIFKARINNNEHLLT